MVCHICNTQIPIPRFCPNCGALTLYETGVGTEQVEEFLKKRYMDVGIERIDRDSIGSRNDLDQALTRIHNHTSEIVVGTQMLAKGHDFPDVTLVGILDVDSGLFSDDFRALEQTIQLITQVAGRAGRAKKKGTVIIQTIFPEHQMLLRLTQPDFNYTDLAQDLLRLRERAGQPPYTQQAVVMASSLIQNEPYEFLVGILNELMQYSEILTEVSIGPVLPDRIEKRINRYHYHFVLTSQNHEALKKVLYAVVNISQKSSNSNQLRFAVDVDPFISP